ncbi:hypothetical protein GCM10009854_13560 [Saccharopolyspora halophila]|uniref:Uncharacterized protein n=1 Tax=Saccharopolyspora halophila TaxID=405551 RepID=A0ABP5STT5_9PSEU
MSEYQYHEFRALERPLDDEGRAELRELDPDAAISALRLIKSEGDLHGDPDVLMETRFDAHLNLTAWGTRRLMLRLRRPEPDRVQPFSVPGLVEAWTSEDFVILDLTSEDETDEALGEPDLLFDELLPLRDELLAGDLRPLYLAWLAAYGTWERDELAFEREADEYVEPPVPAGLGEPTTAQRHLAEFLRLDPDLLAEAATSAPASRTVGALLDGAARRRAGS